MNSDFATDAIRILLFLFPGFISLKIVSCKNAVAKEEYDSYLVQALVHSVIIYMIAGFLKLNTNLLSPQSIFLTLLISVLVGLFVGELTNREWTKYIFKDNSSYLSPHDKVFFANRKIILDPNKWHLVSLKDGTEYLGFIKQFNTENNELLLIRCRKIIDGSMAENEEIVYLPPNEELLSIRCINSQGETNE
ncbi:hypothetical protein EGM51_09830 [Verrucomicrobia bacterium S94]|nr:hypothetical protein EGM51_09830 [Verrucomicrobia bacterium S94]